MDAHISENGSYHSNCWVAYVCVCYISDPGIIMFEKRGTVVKESAGIVSLSVIRFKGSDGEVAIKYRTIDKSAISGRDYKGGTGEIVFKNGEVRLDISSYLELILGFTMQLPFLFIHNSFYENSRLEEF